MVQISKTEAQTLIDVALRAADCARKITLSHFRQSGLTADNKASEGFDPVTLADRQAELAIREVLQQARPQDAILGEEYGETAGTSGLTWVLDPIDGTRGYVSGTPTWGTLISVRDADGPLMGLIDQPYIGERFIGGFGMAELQRDGQITPLSVQPSDSLETATLLSTFPEIGSKTERQAFDALSERVQLTRYGMDCYGYALLAIGSVDLVVEAGLHAYDIQAPIAVVTAAGGIVTDWQGHPVHDGGRVLAAASPELHEAALNILSKAPEG